MVTGNCGISLAPYVTAAALPPLNLLGAQSFRYPTLAAYRDAVAAAQPALNVAALIGHTTLRFATMDDLTRAASADERARMAALLEACMADGAFGLSSGLFYEEAYAAPADEVTDAGAHRRAPRRRLRHAPAQRDGADHRGHARSRRQRASRPACRW